MRRLSWTLGLLMLLALLWWGNRPLHVTGSVVSVSDGDSFVLTAGGAAQPVRLLGIDAPELAQLCDTADGLPWPCGKQARSAAHSLAAYGPMIRCTAISEDKFARALSRCRLADGRDLAAELVVHGWAVATNEDYVLEQAAARRARVGIWRGEFQAPADWRAANPRSDAITPQPFSG